MLVNRHKLIFFRNKMALLANVSGTTQSMPMSDPDIAMIEVLLTNNTISDTLSDMSAALASNPTINALFPDLAQHNINNRLAQYQHAKLLIDAYQHEPATITPIQLPSLSPAASVDETQILRLSTHFAVVFCQDGFAVWSTVHSEFIRLSAIEVMLLLAFGDGNTCQQVLSQKSHLNVPGDIDVQQINGWLQAGLLAEEKAQVTQTQEVLQPFETQTESAIGVETDWQALEKTDKIPVYFVPHMENHLPLALGVLFSALVDYQDGALCERFQFIPINYLEPHDLLSGPYKKFGPGVWLFSNYMWSIDVNMQISQSVKQHNYANFCIHGGPSTPDYEEACRAFLTQHPSVDIAVHGEGEVTICEIFDCITRDDKKRVRCPQHQLAQVPGLSFKDELTQTMLRSPARERMKTPDDVPSPYLNGFFDGYKGRVEAAIIETNRGCPYGCTFCDWGSATNQKIRKYDIDRVAKEIEWIGKNQVRVLWIADANFGLYDRDIEISKMIVGTKTQYGFPQEIVVNYTKNSTWRLVEIIKILSEGGIIGQGIISIQTTDEQTLDVINRKNIRTQRYDELAQAFTDLNLPLSTDLMIGLPGMTVDSFTRDLQRYIDMDISVKAYPTQLLPNSPMAAPDYMQKYQIKADEHGFLTSTFSYTQQELSTMRMLHDIYVMADGYGLLRYVIRYLQWEHNIPAMQFMHDLMQSVVATPDRYPILTWAVRFFNGDKSMPSGWLRFYEAIQRFIVDTYSIPANTGLSTVLCVNQAVMPDDTLPFPRRIALDHDFVAYFHQSTKGEKPLAAFAPGVLHVSDPNRLSILDLDAAQYDSHQYFWELHSEVSRPKSLAEFAA